MNDYNLGYDETVICDCKIAQFVFSRKKRIMCELVLTNYHLIRIEKGTFGKTKNVVYSRIDSIKLFDDKAQVRYSNGELTVFFFDHQDTYMLDGSHAREIGNSINRLLTGSDEDIIQRNAVSGIRSAAETLRGSIDAFKNGFGIKEKEAEKEVSMCQSCGASVSGEAGKVFNCPYCGTAIKIQKDSVLQRGMESGGKMISSIRGRFGR